MKTILPIRWGFLLLLLLLPVHYLQAAPSGPEYVVTASAGYRFSSDSSSEFFYNYEVLRELAREQLVEIPFVKLGFAMEARISVGQDPDGHPLVSVEMMNYSATGKTSYRGFDIAAFLLPASGTIEIIHADKSDPTLSRTYTFPSSAFGSNSTTLPIFTVNRFDPATDTLIVRVSSICFGAGELARLRERISLVNDYYASVSLLDSAMQRAGHVRLDSLSHLPYSLVDIMEIGRVTELVYRRHFDSTLINGGPDPKGLRAMRQEALRTSKTLEYNFLDRLEQLANLPPAPCPPPPANYIDSLANHFVAGMVRYIRLSAMMNDVSGNIYNDYLDSYYSLTAFPDEKTTALSMLEKMYPSATKDTLLQFASERIYDAYKLAARELIGGNRYAEAFALVRHARLFKQKDPFLKNVNGTEELLSEAAKGVYSSYLGIAATSISYDKFEMAEIYLRKALDYKRNNETWFTTDTLYGSVFMKLFRKRLEQCDNLVVTGYYRDAIDCYHAFESSFDPELVAMVSPWVTAKTDTAWRLLFASQEKQAWKFLKKETCDSLFVIYNDLSTTFRYLQSDTSEERRFAELKKAVLPVKFRISSETAYRLAETRDYTAAWKHYLEADSAANELGMAYDSAFCALQRDLFRWHAAEELSGHTGYIWNDRFDSAWIYLGGMRERIETMGLAGDTVLATALERYRQKILRKQCMNLSEEADILILRASRNAEQGRYSAAYRQFSDAQAIAAERPECSLNYPSLPDSMARYWSPALYQSLTDTLQVYYTLSNYARVFSLIGQMEKEYTSQGLAGFGLPRITLKGFIADKNDQNMTMAAVEMMIVNARPDDAVDYMKLLKSFGALPGSCSQAQETVGLMLARRDIGTGVIGDCKEKLASYTDNDKWFRELAKAYCSAFR